MRKMTNDKVRELAKAFFYTTVTLSKEFSWKGDSQTRTSTDIGIVHRWHSSQISYLSLIVAITT